jgi:beta-lactamase class D
MHRRPMFVRPVLFVLILVLTTACGRAEAPHAPPSTTPPIPSSPRACFLLYEMGVGEVRRSPAEACATRITPASTFKIPHALAALDSKVLAGPDITFHYDGHGDDGPKVWMQDHTLATAMRHSVVWYFQRVATMLGPEREHEYVARFDYGNQDTSSGLTTFWLDESLRISPDEQEKFILRLYEDALPVSKEAMRTVRGILIQPPGVVVNAAGEHPFAAPWPEGTVVSAKPGRGDDVTWLVGHVQRQNREWVFVSCVIGPTETDPLAAINLAAASLHEERVL